MTKVILGEWSNGGSVRLDVPRLIETRALIQANSGGGKSWLLRKLLETTHGHVQQIIVDPEGATPAHHRKPRRRLRERGPLHMIFLISFARHSIDRETDIVRRMPPLERRVFTLRKVYDHSQPQIASELHLSADEVNAALVRATRLFAAGLDR